MEQSSKPNNPAIKRIELVQCILSAIVEKRPTAHEALEALEVAKSSILRGSQFTKITFNPLDLLLKD